MPPSSLLTYMDVTKSSRGTQSATQQAAGEPAPTAEAAKVLAAIHTGTDVATELGEKTGLSDEDVLAALSLLTKTRLIELEKQDGILHARLTEPTKAALSSA